MKRRAEIAMVDTVRVRVLGRERRAIVLAAKRQGISISEFTRRAMAEAVERLAA